jgi:competence protein ComFA
MKQNVFVCPRCGNSDPRYIGYRNGKPYCRKCITFSGREAKEIDHDRDIFLELDYELSDIQKEVSKKVLNTYIKHKDSLIKATTGAGKTELVFASMEYALKLKQNVGFAIPRRDVVIDLYPRIKSAFPNARVTYVIGDHSKILTGDIILLTTHQLYRYHQYFDLLIVDEIDAFPYKGNSLLNRFLLDSVRGNKILLSATPSSKDISNIKKNGEIFEVNARYHRHPLPVPEFKKANISIFFTCIKYLKMFLKEKKPVLVFCPTITLSQSLFRYLRIFYPNGAIVNSEEEFRNLRVARFKRKELSYLVTTSILERGITIEDLQVIVCYANHPLYDSPSLIQIAGRVGRKIRHPDGKVIFIGEYLNDSIRTCIKEITDTNTKAHMQNLL